MLHFMLFQLSERLKWQTTSVARKLSVETSSYAVIGRFIVRSRFSFVEKYEFGIVYDEFKALLFNGIIVDETHEPCISHVTFDVHFFDAVAHIQSLIIWLILKYEKKTFPIRNQFEKRRPNFYQINYCAFYLQGFSWLKNSHSKPQMRHTEHSVTLLVLVQRLALPISPYKCQDGSS